MSPKQKAEKNDIVPEMRPQRTTGPFLLGPQILQTPKFDPQVHKSPVKSPVSEDDEANDSFVESIITHSPSKPMFNSKENEKIPLDGTADNQSKNVLGQKEDPLDAMDALEDAIEQIGQALPVVDSNGLDSPLRSGTPADDMLTSKAPVPKTHISNSRRRPMESAAKGVSLNTNSKNDVRLQRSGRDIPMRKPLPTRSNEDIRKSTNPRPASIAANSTPRNPDLSRKSSHPVLSPRVTSSTPASVKSRPVSIQASTSRPALSPVKSTKSVSPTRPTFELPGDARFRQRKAEREEKLKRETEELQRKRESKVKEVRNTSTGLSLTSKRTTLNRPLENNIKSNDIPKIDKNETTTKRSTVSPTRKTEQANSMKTPTRSNSTRADFAKSATLKRSLPDLREARRTSTMTPNTRVPSLSTSPLRRSRSCHNSVSPQGKPAANNSLSKAEAAVQRARGKEIFERDMQYIEERERERREKEEAAKRARAEAAERGRLASREWAEKQRLRAKTSKRNLNEEAGNIGITGNTPAEGRVGKQQLQDKIVPSVVVNEEG